MPEMRVIAPLHARTKDLAALSARQAKRRWKMQRDNRVICGARRRRDGQPCEALSVPGKKRCKWHGGCSTGPRTPEGKARVTANLRKWADASNAGVKRRRRRPLE